MKNKYVKRPIPIEAIQWDGTNLEEIVSFCGNACNYRPYSETLIIKTLEGDHIASQNDFIIKGVKGEFYPCKPDIFNETYSLLGTKIEPKSRGEQMLLSIEQALSLFEKHAMLSEEMMQVKIKLQESHMWLEKSLLQNLSNKE